MIELATDLHAPSAPAVFYRSYSRRTESGARESFEDAIARTVTGISEVGHFSNDQFAQCLCEALDRHTFPSGRALWVSGTEWSKEPINFPGFYNCCSLHVDDVEVLGLLMDLAMMGTGTGAVLEEVSVSKLPNISYKINIVDVIPISGFPGAAVTRLCSAEPGNSDYDANPFEDDHMVLKVGDSRQGWVEAYMTLIRLSMGIKSYHPSRVRNITLDLSGVRPSGYPLRKFGGVANPVKLESALKRVAARLTHVADRKVPILHPLDVCLLIDEAATAVVAGNIRRSAGMRQFSSDDSEAADSKLDLYVKDENGKWSVDPEREALRMANHTRCFHHKPSYSDVLESVEKQYYSGEGAIQYVPEAIVRANADVIDNVGRTLFLDLYNNSPHKAKELLRKRLVSMGLPCDQRILEHRMTRYGLNPCGEIIMRDNLCNLAEVHLNTLDPNDDEMQRRAFETAGLQAAALLHHQFVPERLSYSRRHDPIVGISFTGLFDFLVCALGADWLKWMMEGRPEEMTSDDGLNLIEGPDLEKQEREYLQKWRSWAAEAVKSYCASAGIKCPNRFTTVQPAGTKSLLTGASSGWHPPKSQYFIRRITFGVEDPLVSALRDWGYAVVPAQSSRDEEGNLLDDITDPRVREVLVEIPTAVSWAGKEGCDKWDLSKLPIESQWGLYMQVQTYYTDHNTSATLEIRSDEIEGLANLIHKNIEDDGGYMSAAVLARFDDNQTFPRMPFEPITKQQYDVMLSSVLALRGALSNNQSFDEVLARYDNEAYHLQGAAGCDSDKCLSEAVLKGL